MGPSPVGIKQPSRENFLSMLRGNFTPEQYIEHPMFGRVRLYRSNLTNKNELMLKSICYSDEVEAEKIKDELKSRISEPHPNLLSIYYIDEVNYRDLCTRHGELCIYAQFQQGTVKNDLLRRKRAKGQFLREEQIWKVLLCLTNAIKYLHSRNLFHGQIRSENVMLDPSSYHIKLVQRTLLSEYNWSLNQNTLQFKEGKGVLFSPIILECLAHGKSQLNQFDPFKADVYALGMQEGSKGSQVRVQQ